MKTRTIVAMLGVPAAATTLFAQQEIFTHRVNGAPETMIAQGSVGFINLAGEPGAVKFMSEEFFFNSKPVTSAAYSAEEKTESVQSLADGTRITNSTTARVFRDNQGRTRREVTLPLMEGETMPRTMITISDPVEGVSYSLDTQTNVAHQMMNPMKMADAKVKAELDAKVADLKRMSTASATASSTAIISGAPGQASQTMEYRVVRRDSAKARDAAQVQHDDLGATMIEGVRAVGSRETSTIAAGAIGNDRPITITSERWFSPELQVELKSTRTDPRMGQTTHVLSNISRTEPDVSMFKVPSGYTIDGRMETRFEVHTDH